ncbi:unnamed protein product [Ilex paraguariensis]|uniref:Growth-regulating factor n=1 Tax=Ilex paraguariensis TaxID=185542 RepID=A0ABC8R7R5_9AQUA
MVSTGRNRYPFTASQWQELEHQALIFKYMVSGMPIPPDLLFTIKRSLDSSLSSKLMLQQPQHIGWNCFQMGFGKKIDPEPGRCRRTDGKKWRCSKEAYPDSKYCERHMHRGRNRSRKPVEVMTTSTTNTSTPTAIPISSITKSPNPSNASSLSLSEPHYPNQYSSHVHYPFLSPHSSSSRSPGIGLLSQDHTNHFVLECGPYSHINKDYRYGYGVEEEVDEHAFFSEPSGTMRSISGSSMDDSWRLTPLTMGSFSSLNHLKQRPPCSGLQNGYSYLQFQSLSDTSKHQNQDQHHNSYNILGSDIKCEMPLKLGGDDEPQKVMHHFFDEGPPKNKDSWIESEDKLSNHVPVSKTQLSISMPEPDCSHDFFITHNDK